MMPTADDLYLRLPPLGRTLAASVMGLQLRWRRYGPGFGRLVAEVRARDGYSADQWEAYQRRALERLLARALTRVPHYAAQGRALGLTARGEHLHRWPILEKGTLRTAGDALLADDVHPRRMVRVSTSGSTGTPIAVHRSATTERQLYAMFEARVRKPFGVSWTDHWAIMSGRVVAPYGQTSPPFWVVNWPMKQLYLSVYHLADRFASSYLDALQRFRPTHLLGYPSALHVLARFVLESGRAMPPLQVIITNAEPLYQHQRSTLQQAFQCPIVETYGMVEMTAMATACRAGRLHQWPDFAVMELVDESGSRVRPGEVGQVVGTSLLNQEQPLVRYRTGDLAVAAPAGYRCACGSAMPVLERVEGRTVDTLLTLDGRRVGAADTFLDLDLNVKETQLIQEGPGRFVIRYVPAEGPAPSLEQVSRALRSRVGECTVRLEPVDRIERTSNGKMRSVIASTRS